MSRTLLVAGLAVGIGLTMASAQEKREEKRQETRTPAVERSAERPSAVRPLPPTTAETAASPERPADARGPLVSVQMVMAEATLEADKHDRPSASAQSPKGGAAIGAIDLSAPDEKLREELRKLGVEGQVDLLYRFSLAAADGQKLSLQLNQTQPQISGITITQFGQTNNVNMLNTGTTIEIQPRVAGEIVSLTLSLTASRLGAAQEGVPIAVTDKGESARAVPTHSFSLRTAVNVPSGQTIVLTGLASEEGPRKRQTVILLCPRIVAFK